MSVDSDWETGAELEDGVGSGMAKTSGVKGGANGEGSMGIDLATAPTGLAGLA